MSRGDRLEDEPLWYKDAVIYELHVRAFADADGDGIGDFRGLTERLDYLQDLGVTALWLLPFYPSPLRDDGYDIADYTGVHPDYGSLADFKAFLREAHRRGLRVITELVVNHTSDQHPWFQKARRAKPGSKWRDFYVWSDDPERYPEARIIFKDFEASNWTYDPVAGAYYWHRFYHHQPDLNFDAPQVHKAVLRVMDFWLRMGVDGMRLDAIPYLYEREGTNCENLPESHAFLKHLRRHVDAHYDHRMLLAEANQWPEDSAAYFGEGDECHMAFHFPVMPRLFMALRMEDRFPIVDILQQTPEIPSTCQWAIFLRNHDELTLEMVTDEDRDYMYRVYASDPRARINLGIRRRLAPLLGNDRRRIELMKALLLSLPGTPVLYYGDEIGMGDNFYLGDRNGVRTPMQWSADRNAGFSRANPQRLYLPVIIDPEYHYESINVEAQQANPHSLLWWTRRLIALRKRYRAFSRGSVDFLYPDNPQVLAFLRRYQDEQILVLANLSRFAQHVELNLASCEGMVPTELFGQTLFPRIERSPYPMTLGPHGFYWFALAGDPWPARVEAGRREQEELPTLTVSGSWESCLTGRAKGRLEAVLGQALQGRRWFGGKARKVQDLKITASVAIPLGREGQEAHFTLIEVKYLHDEPETYGLHLAFASDEEGQRILEQSPEAAIARLKVKEKGGSAEGVVFDALYDPDFAASLLRIIGRRRTVRGKAGTLAASVTKQFSQLRSAAQEPLHGAISKAEQSNTSVLFGHSFILKLFRKIEAGVNPDLEIGRFLTERAGFPHVPPLAGALEYRSGRREPLTVGILQGYVENEGDAWTYSLDVLGRFFERVLSKRADGEPLPVPPSEGHLLHLTEIEVPPQAAELIGLYLASAELLGCRTAELHLALASRRDDPDFAPEPFTSLYQRSLYQSMRSLAARIFQLLERRHGALEEPTRGEASELLARRDEIMARFQPLLGGRIQGKRLRCHGDYHLGQVLWTGKDFVIIDFEGEPARPLSERRIKRSPFRDVAGMVRSFDYAAHSSLRRELDRGTFQREQMPEVEAWARFWYRWSAATFLRSYLQGTETAAFVPSTTGEVRLLLDVFLLDKALYELGYELNNRPAWVGIPSRGILQLLEGAEPS